MSNPGDELVLTSARKLVFDLLEVFKLRMFGVPCQVQYDRLARVEDAAHGLNEELARDSFLES